MTNIISIPLAQIREHPDDPRYAKGDVKSLADSITENGLLEPLLVAHVVTSPESGAQPYTVLSGHRRLAALKLCPAARPRHAASASGAGRSGPSTPATRARRSPGAAPSRLATSASSTSASSDSWT